MFRFVILYCEVGLNWSHFEPFEDVFSGEVQGQEDEDPGGTHEPEAFLAVVVDKGVERSDAALTFDSPVVCVAVLDVGVDDHVGCFLVDQVPWSCVIEYFLDGWILMNGSNAFNQPCKFCCIFA